ncbi:precorrin-6y C5,15-methyltransferase (decarboxylating) subunit CbiE [Tsukamurella soli]|uniref:precorrin-6y C5,15-methyltransferase (decarboxylating) subunit CbiE n=1 Tax=Tsukamurella soli TaxID=644556 RepID=UPI00362381B3
MTVTVVGIGADGWAGLTPAAQRELLGAKVIHGSARQLAALPAEVAADRREWPSPLLPALDALADGVTVLASGDPMLYGVGATLARRRPDLDLAVHPHVSSVALACARLGWGTADTVVVSAVARDPAPVVRHLRLGRNVLVLSESGATPAVLERLVADAGVADVALTVLEQLGGPGERVRRAPAEGGVATLGVIDDLNVLALAPTGAAPVEFENDGQITKPDVRALTVAALDPRPGQTIWDVGAGSGSVGITWAGAYDGTVVAVEKRSDRAERVTRNAAAVGVRARVIVGSAPESLVGLPTPDAVFIGGGLSDAVVYACWGRCARADAWWRTR